MALSEDAKFDVNDVVVSEGNGVGRIARVLYATPAQLKREGQARIAGTGGSKPEWFYKVDGKGYDKEQWYRETTLQLASDA